MTTNSLLIGNVDMARREEATERQHESFVLKCKSMCEGDIAHWTTTVATVDKRNQFGGFFLIRPRLGSVR